MPLYDFSCPHCAHACELLVSFAASPACPRCGAGMTRLLSRPAPEARSKAILAAGRAQAAKEGHFSNYSRQERQRRRV